MGDLTLKGMHIDLATALRVPRESGHSSRSGSNGPSLSPLLRPAMSLNPDPAVGLPVASSEPPNAGHVDYMLEEPDDLAAAKGIFLALLMSVPLWVVMLTVVVLAVY